MAIRTYLPALRFHALTWLYDPLVAILCMEKSFKSALVTQVALQPGQAALDLGCGSGTLTLALKEACPGAAVLGVDADERILQVAEAKKGSTQVEYRKALVQDLDSAIGRFDHVVTSLFFHHLPVPVRDSVLVKIQDHLKEFGQLHIADWDRPANAWQRVGFCIVRTLDGWELTRGHAEGRMGEWLRAADYRNVERTRRFLTPLGTISLWKADAPTQGAMPQVPRENLSFNL